MTAGSSMHALMRSAPPQAAQVSMSIPNTRLRRCAQVIAVRRAAGLLSCVHVWPVAALPRPDTHRAHLDADRAAMRSRLLFDLAFSLD